MNSVLASLLLVALFAVIVGLNIFSYRETKRRALLSPEERNRLEEEDAAFAQQNPF